MIKDELLNVFLTENTLTGLVKAISGATECPVIIVDDAFHIAASCAVSEYNDPTYRIAVSHSELSLDACAAISAHTGETDFTVDISNKKYRVLRLESNGAVLGYMILVCIVENMPCDTETLNFTAALVSKQLFFERRQSSAGTAEKILAALFDGEFSDEEHFKISAASTYLSNFNPERFAVIDLRCCTPAAAVFLQAQLESEFHASHPFIYKGKTVMFLHGDHSMPRLAELAEQNGIATVISGKLDGVFSAAALYPAVTTTLDYLNEKGTGGLLAFADDYALLLILRTAVEKGTVFDVDVKKIAEYDKENSGELCLTLYTYLCCRHSLKDTCERLYTHRNTVLYRIRRIKEFFGIDTDNPELCIMYLLQAALELVKAGEDALFIRSENKNV